MSIPEPKVEHHEGRGIRSCPIFPELRPILDEAFEIFGDKSEYVVAAPQYRAAANTAMGWKNSNLRSEMTRLLRRAGGCWWRGGRERACLFCDVMAIYATISDR